MTELKDAPVAKAEMLIRKPVAEVFEAFVDPAITTKFWFTKSSGRLAPDAKLRWEWEMYEVVADLEVAAFEPNAYIAIVWAETRERVEWRFTPHGADTTFVSITNTGFSGDGDAQVSTAIGSTEGFTLVLAGLKALLEHGVLLGLVRDRFPKTA